jgi:3-oxoacyl-[acyl-carrier-protein] synthase-3
MQLIPVGILGTGKYLPERIMTNADLEKLVDTNEEWIFTRTGIRERRMAAPEQATSDLAYEAAVEALNRAGLTAEDLDLIIVATLTPDHLFPSTACLVQARLGATKAAAFDLEAACSGFVYALSSAYGYIATGMYKHVLVIGAETLSRITDFTDRNTCILFGDGAGAAVLGPVEEGRGLKSFVMGADGNGGKLLQVCAGGSRMPLTEEVLPQRKQFIYQNGKEVFKFAVRIMGGAAEEAIAKAGLNKADIDLFIPHQANIRIIEAAMERLELTPDKVMINLDKYGNTSAATIPVALAEAVETGRVKSGDQLVLVGFGGGLTWAACVLTW